MATIATRLTRRGFVAGLIALAAALAGPGARRLAAQAARGGRGPHPTPRPGIDASRVLTPEAVADFPEAASAFDGVRQIPQIIDGIRCHCGCADTPGFYSLLSCYEGGGMARFCHICQGEGRLAARMHQQGKTLEQIRQGIDARFG